VAWLTDPRQGIHTRCKFLPAAADVHEFLRERRARRDQFKSPPPIGIYQKFGREPEERLSEADIERRKRLVREALGREVGTAAASGPTQADFDRAEELALRGAVALKSPPGPVSRQLVDQLLQDGFDCPATRKARAEE